MTAVWTGLGAVLGAGLGCEGGGVVGVIACMMGGMIEMAVLGAILALIGGRPQESVVGAVWGLIVSAVTGLVAGHAHLGFVAAFGLVIGAVTGATLRPYLRLLSLPVILLGWLLRPSAAAR